MKDKTACFFRFLTPLIVCVLCAVLLGTVLMTAVYMIPVDRIEDNVILSAQFLKEEGKYHNAFPWCTSRLDNFTDSIMLTEAAYDSDKPDIIEAMEAGRQHINGKAPYDSFVSHYADGAPFDSETTYSRYWHGYLVFLKPILLIADYSAIRMVNLFVQLLLSIIIVCLLVKNKMKKYIIPYLIAYAFIMPVVIAKSLQFSSCYYIMTASCIVLLAGKSKLSQNVVYVFLCAGICTAFFDFLTYPIATFGVPAVMYFCMQEKKSVKENAADFAKIIFAWGIGYVGMWAGKWIIGSFITQENVILNAIESVMIRTSNAASVPGNADEVTAFDTLVLNLRYFLNTPVTVGAVLFVLVTLVLIIINYCKNNVLDLRSCIEILIPFAVVAVLPPVWYAFTLNHSSIHSWFTHKGLVVSAFAVMCMSVKVYTEQKKSVKPVK